ncbi:TIGR01777 family oxidoreductase [Kordiimonas laminariae]|uniref:TIGR01777 family oxidoreductase n=1 Tax=Kordiimonas laminariae TaxID=2917717 RepID=UPI001FF2D15F|nr:TIGR01777 family oxidoreductase [Kordiimonas laminariae]MCK0068064.1 TIGR01777 family oxidoreductase [Kordiimonas laminariae]
MTENPATSGLHEGDHWLIAGGTGLIGSALAFELLSRGAKVSIYTRDAEKAHKLFGDTITAITDLNSLPDDAGFSHIAHLAGSPLAGGCWTKARKQSFFDSRAGISKQINDFLKRQTKKPQVLLSGSAIGYYGDMVRGTADEHSPAGEDFMATICSSWEAEAEGARDYVDRLIKLRTGIVLSEKGGFMEPMTMASKFGLGATLGSGEQWMSWITLEDIIRLILFSVYDTDISGPVNATAAEPVRQKDFQKQLSKKLNRPQFMWAPAFILKLFLQDLSDLFLTGQRVVPQVAQENDFRFNHPTLKAAFKAIL